MSVKCERAIMWWIKQTILHNAKLLARQHEGKGHAPNIVLPVIIFEVGLKLVTGC